MGWASSAIRWPRPKGRTHAERKDVAIKRWRRSGPQARRKAVPTLAQLSVRPLPLCPLLLPTPAAVSSAILPISRHTSSYSSMLAHCPLRSPDDVAAEHSDERPQRACNWGAVAHGRGRQRLRPASVKVGLHRGMQSTSGGVRSPPQMSQQNVTPVSSTALFIPLF